METREIENIVAEDMVVSQGNFTLGPLSFGMGSGKIHCLLGANGAGKSTLLRAIMGVQQSQSGVLKIGNTVVNGRVGKILQNVGFVPDDPGQLLEELTATEYWAITARLYLNKTLQTRALEKATVLAKRFKFVIPDTTISSFSLGMRKKTQIIAALMREPKILILDEPRSALDPYAIKCMEIILEEEARRGAIVLVASHDLYWAERFADKIYILDQGRLAKVGSLEEVTAPYENLAEAYFNIPCSVAGAFVEDNIC